MRLKRNLFISVIFVFIILGCSNQVLSEKTHSSSEDAVRKSNENIVDMGDYYVIEGDIIISKENLDCEQFINMMYGEADTYNSLNGPMKGNILDHDNHKLKWDKSVQLNLTYYFDGNMATAYFTHEEVKNIFRESFVMWQDAANIRFIETNSRDFARIKLDISNISALGYCYWWYNTENYRFTDTLIQIDNDSHTSPLSLKDTILHEIGHALGLAHEHQRADSPYDFGQGIDGVPYGEYDPNSIMNYGSPGNAVLTHGDIMTLRCLYDGPHSGILTPISISNNTYLINKHVYFPYVMFFNGNSCEPVFIYSGNSIVEKWLVGDFNGDNDEEIITKFSGIKNVYYSDDPATRLTGEYCYIGNCEVRKWIAGDFNGDNKDEVITRFSGSTNVYYSDDPATRLTGAYCYTGSRDVENWIVGDFNGDNKDETITKFSGSTKVYYSDDPTTRLTGAYCYTGTKNVENWIVGDFNGDDKDDTITKFSGSTKVYYSDDPTTRLTGAYCYTGSQYVEKWIIGDFNGDNKDEIITKFSGSTKVYYSDDPTTRLTGNYCYIGDENVESWVVGDFDNDGDEDILTKFVGNSKLYFSDDGMSLTGYYY